MFLKMEDVMPWSAFSEPKRRPSTDTSTETGITVGDKMEDKYGRYLQPDQSRGQQTQVTPGTFWNIDNTLMYPKKGSESNRSQSKPNSPPKLKHSIEHLSNSASTGKPPRKSALIDASQNVRYSTLPTGVDLDNPGHIPSVDVQPTYLPTRWRYGMPYGGKIVTILFKGFGLKLTIKCE